MHDQILGFTEAFKNGLILTCPNKPIHQKIVPDIKINSKLLSNQMKENAAKAMYENLDNECTHTLITKSTVDAEHQCRK